MPHSAKTAAKRRLTPPNDENTQLYRPRCPRLAHNPIISSPKAKGTLPRKCDCLNAKLEDIPPLDPEITNLPEHLEIINPKPKRTWWQFPNDDDEGRHVKKRRHSTTREEKLEALSFLKNARTWQINKAGYAELKPLSVRYAAEILGFHESQPRDWKSHEQKIRDAPKNSKKCGVGAPPAWPEMEVRLAAECGEKYRAGYEVNRDWFYRHAKKIYEEEYPNEVEVKDGVKSYLCEFSNGWFQGFKKRHGLSCRDPKGIPAEADEFTVQSSDEDV